MAKPLKPIEIQNNLGLDELILELEGRQNGSLEDAVSAVTQEMWTKIRKKIERGIGYRGRFKKYGKTKASKKYLKWKLENYQRGNPPDLLLEGEMLDSFTTKVERTNRNRIIGIIFSDDEDQAEKIRKNNKSRPFLGVSKEVEQAFYAALKEWMVKHL